MQDPIYSEVVAAIASAGVQGPISLAKPANPSQGDICFPCFALAKEQGKNPVELAEEIVSKIDAESYESIKSVVAQGPYVNITLHTPFLAREICYQVVKNGESFGKHNEGQGKSVLIEYPSQNTHKEFHIGHVRNVCIGNVLVALRKKMGYNVTAINYVNDFGSHVAKCLWGIVHLRNGEVPKEDVQSWLGDVYAQASKHIADHPEVKDEVAALQNKIEAKDPEIWPLFLQTRDASLAAFDVIQKELGINHKTTILESDIKDDGQAIVDELLENGIAMVGEGGAIIADLSDVGLDIALLRKSSGAGVYATSDLALAKKKAKDFGCDESINITAIEQNFYFKQLFEILKREGHTELMTHIGYGLVTRPDGKMSSRLGNVILYVDLRDQIYDIFYTETKARHQDWSEEELHHVAHTLTLASMKFTMQKHEAKKNIVFDEKEATSFEGYSAPYILYTIARINSLIEKGDDVDLTQLNLELLDEPSVKALLILVSEYGAMIKKANDDNNPAVITKYCFDLAQEYSNFYHSHTIVNADDPQTSAARLFLSRVVRDVLKDACSVLSIDILEKM